MKEEEIQKTIKTHTHTHTRTHTHTHTHTDRVIKKAEKKF